MTEEALKYLPLVRKVRRHTFPGYWQEADVEDLEAEGMVGLIRGLREYDPDKGPLEPYLWRRIQGAMLDYARKQDRLTRTQRQRRRDLDACIMELRGELGRVPTSEEVAERLGITIDEYWRLLNQTQSVSFVTELTDGDGERTTIYDVMASEEEGPDVQVERQQLLERIRHELQFVKPRDRQILQMYFLEECTLAEIAAVFGVSVPRVSQIVKHTLQVIRLRLEGVAA